MLRVLHVVNKWRHGGTERFVEGLVDGGPDDVLEQSILSVCTDVRTHCKCRAFGPLVDRTGMVPMAIGSKRLKGFLSENMFDVIHVHTQNSSGFLYAQIAKEAGVPIRVIHSHSSRLGDGNRIVKQLAQSAVRIKYGGAENVRLACSVEAGRHLFKQKGFCVIPNGIDTDQFLFNDGLRHKVRSDLGLCDEDVLVGCVGSLLPVKNHSRALDIFASFQEIEPRSKLLILGDGALRRNLEDKVVAMGLTGSVMMPGFVEDAHTYYHAMDKLLFPSLYEGLPISTIEAQCNGLPVIASDAVSREIAVTDLCQFVSLHDSNSAWARALSCSNRDKSDKPCELVRAKGFDRQTTIKLILDAYCSEV